MSIQIDDLIKIATQVRKKSTKTLRGRLEQIVIVIAESSRQQCFDLLSTLPKEKNKWIIDGENGSLPIQIISDDSIMAVKIAETRVYESRLADLDMPDDRRIAIIKKKIIDARAGKLQGTSVALLKQLLADRHKISLRATIEKKIMRELPQEKVSEALKKLEKVSKVLLTNYETAPTRFRLTWKGPDGQHHSRALSNGISLVFENSEPLSSQGWISDVIKMAREQGARVNGVYFPLEISDLARRKGTPKTKRADAPKTFVFGAEKK